METLSIDTNIKLKKRLAFGVISIILFLAFLAVRDLPSHESSIHAITASVNSGI